jgi:hypothetical protein
MCFLDGYHEYFDMFQLLIEGEHLNTSTNSRALMLQCLHAFDDQGRNVLWHAIVKHCFQTTRYLLEHCQVECLPNDVSALYIEMVESFSYAANFSLFFKHRKVNIHC